MLNQKPMPADKFLLERLRNIMNAQKVAWTEKKMFGGDCFMVDDKMCFGTYKGGLLARIAPEEEEELSKRKGAEPSFMGDRPMVGYLFIKSEGYDSDQDLEFWIKKCLEFNPRAKSSKKK